MCGIAGLTQLDGSRADAAVVAAMTRTLAHRGPDADGIAEEGQAALGHRRLSIIDLGGGAQPMYSHDRSLVVTFNGEIFNFVELREELVALGSTFATRSDTEVILEAYRRFGIDCVKKLNGQFAFAIYDIGNKRLFLARDRMGEKPLYYTVAGGALAFASELKALIPFLSAVGRAPQVSAQAFVHYASLNYVPFSETLIDGVVALPPGHGLIVESGQVRTVKLIPLEPPDSERNAPHTPDRFEELLRESVRIRLRSDVPVGVFLSGGIDSSLVSWAVRAAGMDLTAFVAHFAEAGFSEADNARMVCDRLGMKSEIITVDPNGEDIVALIEKIVEHGDEPLADSSALAVYLLSRETRRSVKVVLSGDGGDELFGGYLTYQATMLATRMGRLTRRLVAPLDVPLRLLPRGNAKVGPLDKLERFVRNLGRPPGEAHFAWNGMFGPEEKLRLLHPDVIRHAGTLDTFEALATRYLPSRDRPTVGELAFADEQTYLVQDILAKVDRMTMAHGLEARPVLLDPRIVDFANTLPDNERSHGFTGKVFIRRFFRRSLPWYPLDQKKQGFSIPVNLWFRTRLRDFTGDLFSSAETKGSGLFNVPELMRIFGEHQRRRQNLGFELWGAVAALLWWRRYVGPGRIGSSS